MEDKTLYNFSEGNLLFLRKRYLEPPHDYFSMHTHNIFELLYIIEGNVTHVIEDRKYKLRKGDVILIRPFQYHFIQIDSPKATYDRVDILFDIDNIDFDMSLISEKLNVLNISAHPRLSDSFSKLDFYASKFENKDFMNIFKGILKEILYNLSLTEPEESSPETTPILTEAIRYINQNLFTLKDVKEISDAVFVTEGYLYKLFKQELHKGPKKYLTEKRILAAQKKILFGEKPFAVFEKCGFSDYTTFYRCYVKYFGHPPSEENRNILL